MAGVAPGIVAWGIVTGVAMVNSGLTAPLALFMSLVVFAGSAQLAALPLIAAGAPMWVVWTTAACVNLRFVIFSAQLRPYWIDLPRRQRALLAYFTADMAYAMFVRRGTNRDAGATNAQPAAGGSLDELSTLGPNTIAEFYQERGFATSTLSPDQFPLQPASVTNLLGGDRQANAEIVGESCRVTSADRSATRCC